MPATIVSVREVTKDFPGLRALDRVSLQIRSGEILALLGQNGSGKSTLVKILAGVYSPDEGEVCIADSPGRDAHSEVLHFIHQELGLIESLSTVENLGVGRAFHGPGLSPLRRNAERIQARSALARFGAAFDVDLPVSRLTPAQRTIVAIVRAMDGWTDPRTVLVLDEPTAALHGEEVGVLFRAVREAARGGAGVIFISHRLEEVVELADRVAVLRDGKLVADRANDGLTAAQLATLIVGRETEIGEVGAAPTRRDDVAALSVRGLSGATVRSLDLDVWPGEVVGVAGSLGSGREHVAGLVFGSHPRTAGLVLLGGRPVRAGSPHASMRRGVALVPADRRTNGAVMTHDVLENISLPELRSISRGRIHLSRGRERQQAAQWMERVDLRPRLPRRPLGLFSGGNQQKVVIARWLRTAPRVLLIEEPTQGVDIGSSEAIRALIVDAAAAGVAVLVVSSDHTDLLRMCHRVLVLRDGRLTAELPRAAITEHRLTKECLGISPRELVTSSEELSA